MDRFLVRLDRGEDPFQEKENKPQASVLLKDTDEAMALRLQMEEYSNQRKSTLGKRQRSPLIIQRTSNGIGFANLTHKTYPEKRQRKSVNTVMTDHFRRVDHDEVVAAAAARRRTLIAAFKSRCGVGNTFLVDRQIIGRAKSEALRSRICRLVSDYVPFPVVLGVKPSESINPMFNRPLSRAGVAHTVSMDFDSMGCLLATGGKEGRLRLFDFDEYFSQIQKQEVLFSKLENQMQNTHISNNVESLDCIEIQSQIRNNFECAPLDYECYTGIPISQVQWNPINQNQIVTSFGTSSDIHMYDVENEDESRPSLVLKTSNNNGSRVGTIGMKCFNSNSVRGGNSIVAVDVHGMIRLWDIRCSSKRPLFSVQINTSSQNTSKKIRINNLAIGHYNQVYCSTSTGVIGYDIRKLSVPTFGAKRVPKMFFKIETSEFCRLLPKSLRKVNIRNISIPNSDPTQMICVLDRGWVLSWDIYVFFFQFFYLIFFSYEISYLTKIVFKKKIFLHNIYCEEK